MADRKLRYSERKRLAETGALGDYVHDDAPVPFRYALWYLIHHPETSAQKNMIRALEADARLHFGWVGDETAGSFVQKATVDDLLDFIEILIEACTTRNFETDRWNDHHRKWITTEVMPDVESRVNLLCERHRFGYRFEDGEARKLGSPALDVVVVGPTLLAVKRPGWEQVEKSYREALDHQCGGETDDAITAAHAAVEAALKAIGMSGQFSTMVKQFRNSNLVPGYLLGTPEALEAVLTLLDRSNAIRSTEGDAHGKPPGAEEAPQALADLAIHWVGAFIVYLAATIP
jgi:hypothetical protein